MCCVVAVSGKRHLPLGRVHEGEEAKVYGFTLCSWTHRRGEQFKKRNLTCSRIAFYFSQTSCRVCVRGGQGQLARVSQFSLSTVWVLGIQIRSPGLVASAFPLLGSLIGPQLKKTWVYLEVQVLCECRGEVMAVKAVRLRQTSKFLAEKASFHFLSTTGWW